MDNLFGGDSKMTQSQETKGDKPVTNIINNNNINNFIINNPKIEIQQQPVVMNPRMAQANAYGSQP
jgi:hypothetical protein